MRKSKMQSQELPLTGPDDPRLPPYSRLTNPKFLTPEWTDRRNQVEANSVSWSEWKNGQRKDQSPSSMEESMVEFDLVSPGDEEEDRKKRRHAKDMRNTGNMA